MRIVVNGEPREVADGITVLQLLESLGLDPSRVAVELNTQIVKKPEWPHRTLESGARLEIVHFVGGG
ncbi:MAG TPA: sulfur carrier protein ThiS [Bryobacteraceae bacterium]|nr:sulfur carrier protein ThiS [Bryobacteraceae bacterium]HOL71822.1 sulfur carrier protein ThiS [Bryobacteraceae bacterium]HOQ44758.1 sulfur carrier protein ThiS [Bryobacteraceae bacterium]HPQ15052.1 sulfur carrier protein ThiS [Bryobacteraceae bacterium]HPU71968.1 sulfur carrier protein ThiS [Bryobacteraceae bacterium]